jgi:hypothetical protein
LAAQFVDKAGVAGVDLNYPAAVGTHSEPGLDPFNAGSASCACDLDGDGWTDLIVTRTGAPCLVFINNRDGTFREEAALRGLDTVADIGGLAAGDFDNDGHTDVFMAPASGPRYFLFMNDGTGHFREVAVERGAASPVTIEPHRGQSVSLVDYDRDGFLDIHVSEWLVGSTGENAQHSVLLHNRGRAAPAFFENRTAAAGLVQGADGARIVGYASVWADYDGDGYPDVFMVGDFGTSQMWWNNGDGTFTNGTNASGLDKSTDAMGVTLLDYDGDGRLDIFLSAVSPVSITSPSDFFSDNRLFRNLGGRRFSDETGAAGVRNSGWGWGAQSLDANNDGWPDLAVTNGFSDNTGAFQTDPTKLFLNRGGAFDDSGAAQGITDTGYGRSLVILDYDNDGREDIFISQTFGHRILYRNETSAANAHWLNLRFVGTDSNRDGYGCEVTVTAGGRSQFAVYNPTNSYIGQREPRLHFGLGASTAVTQVRIKWPGGAVQNLASVSADQTIVVTEPPAGSVAPVITAQPAGVVVFKDSPVVLAAAAQGTPAPVYNWFKDGVRLTGQTGATLTLARVQPGDAGVYTVTATNPAGSVASQGATVTVTADLGAKSVARWWNEALLDGIRKDIPNPPVHARNLYHLSAALWDAFWACERDGWATRHEVFTKETPPLPATEADRLAAQQQAMSYAAYTVIRQRFARSPGAIPTLAGIRWLMAQFGYDPDFADATGTSPASVGLRIGQGILALTLNDGANEANNYVDATGYHAVNPSLVVRNPGVGSGVDPDHWQPLNLVNTVTQNGIVLGPSVQSFVGSNALNTQTFALVRGANNFVADDPGPPPRFAGATRAEYVRQAVEVLTKSSALAATDGVTIDLSPGAALNNPLGTNDGQGHALNPATGRPYAGNLALRGDYGRVLAEFWADGPNSETPPGHWNVIFNQVSDDARAPHRFLGAGPALRRLEWDVCGYLALNGAVHDAALAAWTLKWEYDSSRPLTMIRYLAGLGQSSDPNLPGYHAGGLPLIPGQIELITAESSAPGQRHALLAAWVGQIAVRAWLGTPPSRTQVSGVGWMLGVNWVPYQLDTFVTPAFPAYISGHSTFSRAAAEVLAHLTGSEFFPGGLAAYEFPAGNTLGFEAGPAQRVELQWATYYDAADQAGLSRLYGGIHIAADDFAGRRLGAKVGLDAFRHFLQLYNPGLGSLPLLSGQPAPVRGVAGQSATFTAVVTAPGAVTFRWQRRAAGQSAWADVPDGANVSGAATTALSLSGLTTAMSGDAYRLTASAAGGTVTSNEAALTVAARDYSGAYFGPVAPAGSWALRVRSDATATFVAYLPNRGSVIVASLVVGDSGAFSVDGTELKSSAPAAFTLSGLIGADGAVTGQLAGLGATLSGAIDVAAGSLRAATFYSGTALETSVGTVRAVVGASGRALVVFAGPGATDGAAGTVDAAGQLTAATGGGGQFSFALGAPPRTFRASLTPAGTSAPIACAGLDESVAPTARVVNLSVRSATNAGAQTLIVGFVITGEGGKSLLLRGMGPALRPLGVVNALSDPGVRLFDGAGTAIAANDDWGGAAPLTARFNALGAFLPAAGSKDAALSGTVAPGLYTLHITASTGDPGVALAELYDADAQEVPAKIVNISARSQVGTGENVLIAGFVVTGNAPQTLLIRGLGPSLAPAGVTGALADPQLFLYRGGTVIAANDNWGGTAALKAAFALVGAGPLVGDTSADAALLVTLPPGVYSAMVAGAGGTTGVGLVEIFLLP